MTFVRSIVSPTACPTWEEAGRWTMDKLYFWKQLHRHYHEVLCTVAADSKHFPTVLVYVDLFGRSRGMHS